MTNGQIVKELKNTQRAKKQDKRNNKKEIIGSLDSSDMQLVGSRVGDCVFWRADGDGH